jgi:omega-6 fatty acid desaturase (delta-12 desaturase)
VSLTPYIPEVAHFHVVHHFFPQIPWCMVYAQCSVFVVLIRIFTDHGAEATQYLSAFLGDHYMRSSEPVFQALWNTYNECQFVEDEGVYFKVNMEDSIINFILLGDILFYRNKRGEVQRRSVYEVQSISST